MPTVFKKLFHAGWRGDMIALIAGAFLPLAFAPFGLYWIAVIAPAALFVCWLYVNPCQAFWRGWLFGLGMFGIGVSWVFVSMHVYGGTSWPLAALFTAIFVMGMALFPALQAYFVIRFWGNRVNKKRLLLGNSAATLPKSGRTECGVTFLAFPLSWILLEWLRSWLLTGFPWLLLAHSQINSPLRGYIPVLGVYGTGFLVSCSSSLIVYSLCHIRRYLRLSVALCILTGLWVGGAALAGVQWTQPFGKPLQVALVQGDIPQSLKWSPSQILPTLTSYYDLTRKHWDKDLIIWPEAAIPLPMEYVQEFLKELHTQALASRSALIIGIPVRVPDSFSFYNAMIVLGNGNGHYYKRYLVPFGEYVPFGGLLRGMLGLLSIPMSDMMEGAARQPDLLADHIKIAPFICYEIAYPGVLYGELPEAKLLVTISNDAWFGDSLAPAQHLGIGQFQALLGGRWLLFVGNNGITAIINARGEVVKRLPQFVRGVLTGAAQPMSGRTPWLYYGDQPIILILWIGLVGLWIRYYVSRRRHLKQ